MAEPLDILKKYWGYPTFRPLQDQIIQSVLSGQDTLALMPTGGGKSICFQIPALCQEGICIVVSPLIALMKDQVYNLQKRNIPAAAIYSGMHYQDIDRTLDNCVFGNIKLLYLSPERLKTELIRERIARMKVNLLAIDEAHCISQWGYDFRPPYLEIAEIRDWMPKTPVLALTATATPEVVKDIQEKLAFGQENVFQKSFARDNLAYVVLPEENKQQKLLEILQKVPGSGVVYARNRKLTKQFALFLKANRIAADFYHAGLSPDVRSQKQEDWINDKIRVMVSTNAFGMGIDKSNVRVVVHTDLPDSLEAYFQEAGRGGRDGKKAYAILLYSNDDKFKLQNNYRNSFPPMSDIRRVYRALGSYFQLALGGGEGRSFDFDLITFIKNFKLDAFNTYACLKILEEGGWLSMTDAVYIPSSIRIKVNKDDLYDYQLKHPNLDTIIKTILRLTSGAFSNYVQVREHQFAKFLKISVLDLIKAFQHLHRENILDYRPQKDKPQIVFLQNRIDADHLVIDQKRFQFRKKRYLHRINKAIEYAEKPICRSQQLLAYFGELDTKPCEVCDVCLGRTKTELSKEEYERYREKIKQLLEKEKLTEAQVIDSFSPKRRNLIIKTIEFLLDESLIDKEGALLIWSKNL